MMRAWLTAVLAAATGCAAATPAGAAPADVAPCSSGQIVVTAAGPEAAVGHRGVTLIFGPAPGAAPCTLTGYPAVRAAGGGSAIAAQPTPRGYLGGLPGDLDEPPTVMISPSQRAESVVEGLSVDAAGHPCPKYTELSVTPPGGAEAVTVTVAMDSCQMQVHPVTQVTIEPVPPS